MNAAFLAGWARVETTPAGPVSLWGQMHRRVSERVRDPLTATALALAGRPGSASGGLDHAVIVSCDLCGIDDRVQEALRSRLAGRVPGLRPEAVFLCATHTHTAPYTADDQSFTSLFGKYALPNGVDEDHGSPPGYQTGAQYAELLVGRLEEVVTRAWAAREPAVVGRALGHAVVGHNRRTVYRDGTAVMYGSTASPDFVRPEAGSDHGVEILYLWRDSGAAAAAGSPAGVVVNVACPSQVVESEHYVSADYWGAVRAELVRRFGPATYLLPLCGAAGDQSPRDLVRHNRGEPDMNDEPGLVEIGRRIADSLAHGLADGRASAVADPAFRHTVASLDLPLRTVTDGEAAGARATYEAMRAGIGAHRLLAGEDMFGLFPPIGVMLRHEEQRERRVWPTEVHALRIGEVALVTNPFELYLDYGLAMKARSRAEQTLVAQITGGWGGYLPTEVAVAGGGYGAVVASGTVGPEGGRVLVDESVKLIAGLWEE